MIKISIIIPTYNNIKYLKFLLNSIQKNSYSTHEIILHINDGSDGTLDFAREKKIKFTHSFNNIGLCSSMNNAYSLSSEDYILYSHDDMYFGKNWDFHLNNEIKKIKHNLFYFSALNISKKNGLIDYDCGESPDDFNHSKFEKFCNDDNTLDLQGSHWAPHIIHKNLWNKIGGFSEIFNPGDGSDPDFCMKLWSENVRIFKCLSKFKVYHFNSLTTRKSDIKLNDGTVGFLMKYGFNPRFFRKYYLRGDNLQTYMGPLEEPKPSFNYNIDLLKNRLKYIYNFIRLKIL